MLTCAAPQTDMQYIAIRAHHITLEDAPGENVIPCRPLRVMEDVFSTIVMAATPGGAADNARLRIELSKEKWARRAERETLYLRLPPESLMLLR